MQHLGFDQTWVKPMGREERVNKRVAEAFAAREAEAGWPFEARYAQSNLDPRIIAQQMEKYNKDNEIEPYDSDALLHAKNLLETECEYLYGSGFESIDSEAGVDEIAMLMANDKSAGPLARREGISTKCEFVTEVRQTQMGPKPVQPRGELGTSRRRGMVEWVVAEITGSFTPTAEKFRDAYQCDTPVYGASLKRELRTVEKVQAGKTRVMFPSSVWDVNLAACLFGTFCHVVASAWRGAYSAIRVGLSREHGGWGLVMAAFAVCLTVFSSDANGWDSSVLSVIWGCAAEVLSKRLAKKYQPKGYEYVMRRLHAWIVGDDGNWWWKHRGNVSGDYLTTTMNSLARRLVQLYTLCRWYQVNGWAFPEYEEVRDSYRSAIFGDDEVLGTVVVPDGAVVELNASFIRATGFEVGCDLDVYPGVTAGDVLFLSAKTVKYGSASVPVSLRPGKVISGALYSADDPDVLRNQFDSILHNVVFDDVAWDWVYPVAKQLVKKGLLDRRGYAARYMTGVAEGGSPTLTPQSFRQWVASFDADGR
jgi:hypothetical protein